MDGWMGGGLDGGGGWGTVSSAYRSRRIDVSAIRIGGGNVRVLPQRKTRNPAIRLTLKERTR